MLSPSRSFLAAVVLFFGFSAVVSAGPEREIANSAQPERVEVDEAEKRGRI